MAKKPTSEAPAPNGAMPEVDEDAPQVGLITQYVKDLSFENPNSPAIYQWQGQPQISIEYDIAAESVSDDVHEVVLKINVKAAADDKTAFRVELAYAALFGLRNVPEEHVQLFLYGEGPRLMFPFARRVVADAVSDGGFAPLLLEPIDFGGLYLQKAAEMAEQEAENGAQA
jgi:preprotein translocase subunit SecB